ncbi:hypothetical protein [Pseudomonas brassicacearum]|uniref:Uncharacterized protein n=1 Tax=Pseudomonas brassicacearum TaxID=930166 RepID=A0AAJ3FXI2_9PSED|nr:hypothetical protein [Pseudomonas brassicacearum]NUT82391.1 hypothetical protein [Pseudomonas brassicacearum]
MSRHSPMLRLSPQDAGVLHQQHAKATAELCEVTRFRKEFDRQLSLLIGYDALRKLHKDTQNALLVADLVKEAA